MPDAGSNAAPLPCPKSDIAPSWRPISAAANIITDSITAAADNIVIMMIASANAEAAP